MLLVLNTARLKNLNIEVLLQSAVVYGSDDEMFVRIVQLPCLISREIERVREGVGVVVLLLIIQ